MLALPTEIVKALTSKVTALAKKYELTMDDLSKNISSNEAQLSNMIDDLSGSEFDMKGLKELQKLLRGNKNE
jgi:type I restriction enzyme M protein